MDFPADQNFRCPISKELMIDPVTICTGVSYERKNIEKWFYTYKKTTCPATMQIIHIFDTTPNHTLKRLIESWRIGKSQSYSSSLEVSNHHDDLISLLTTIESTPFKVSYLKKLKSLVENKDDLKIDLKKSGGVEVLIKIIVQVLDESSDFVVFRACEEALGILHSLPLCEQEYETLGLLVKPECIKSYAFMLQRGSGEARFFAVSLFHKLGRIDHDHKWIDHVTNDERIDFFKSLLEIVSDDEQQQRCTKSSSCIALQVLIDILHSSKRSRLKAIEAGAVCILIELVIDNYSSHPHRSKCEKIMQLIKLLCECPEGRLAFIEHGLGIAAISKKILNVSNVVTKIGVKILWLICKYHPTERVLEEMLMNGAVKKLVAILNIGGGGSSSTKNRVIKMFRLYTKFWKRHPCFPKDLQDFLGLGNGFC